MVLHARRVRWHTSSYLISKSVPGLRGFAAANALDGKNDDEIRAELGERFPRSTSTTRSFVSVL